MIRNITLIRTRHGADELLLELDLPNGEFPYDGHACAHMRLARGTGEEYCQLHLSNVPLHVVCEEIVNDSFSSNHI